MTTVPQPGCCRHELDGVLAAAFKALSDPTRVAIVRQLAGGGEMCACDLEACCTLAQPTVSHHLKVLRRAGLVSYVRRGQWLFYRCEHEVLDQIIGQAAALLGCGSCTTIGRNHEH